METLTEMNRDIRNQLKTLEWDANGFTKTIPFRNVSFEGAFCIKIT